MLYLKNLSPAHRFVRVLLGLLGAAALMVGIIQRDLLIPIGITLVALAVTGLVGWCPMCAMLDHSRKNHRA